MNGTATYLDLLTLAGGELNLNALGDSLADSPDLAQRLLDRLTWMVDSWNLKPTVVPWYQQQIFNLVPGQQSYLIGPGAPDWDAPVPVRLEPNASNLLLMSPPYALGTNPVRIPLTVLSVEQFANISLPALQSTFPNAIYLDRSVISGNNLTDVEVNLTADYPYTSPLGVNGVPLPASTFLVNQSPATTANSFLASRIWVWYTPTTANQIELFYWQALTVGSLYDPVNAPTGYFRAMFLNLAIEIAPGFGITPNAVTIANARDALGDIKELNAPDMRMRPDPGMPSTPGSRYITKAQFLSGVF